MIPIINPNNKSVLISGNEYYEDSQGNRFPVIGNVLRFVTTDNYTANFGFQWNKFQQTQMDREDAETKFSKERLFCVTGWDKQDLKNKDILEVGSGAGRFTQVVLRETQANLYSIDYSDSVTANYKNNSRYGNRLHLFQASIYEMPFPDASFDKVFCFGVLQHTPDFRASVKCLIEKAKPGGEIVVDFYPITGWWTKVHAKYLFRPLTKRMSFNSLLNRIDQNAEWLIRLYNFFDKLGLGKVVNRFLPICDIKGTLPSHLSKKELREWVVLDTFDMFSPKHDHPQRILTVKRWFEEFGATVTHAGILTYADNKKIAVVKGIKK
jgi:SAM-dependent methyltransferase